MDEDGRKFLQITAPISPGSSGGPLFNTAGEVVGITTLYLKGGENLNFATPVNEAKRLLRGNISKVRDFPSTASEGAASSVGYLSNKQICLDGVINTVETPFLEISGEACSLFVVGLPLAPEDAQLLAGNAAEDDHLLSRMRVQYLSAITFRTMREGNGLSGSEEDRGAFFGAQWAFFEQNRDAFCSRHPKMFVFDLKLDGTATPPESCSTPKHKK
jgi:hypothetical protein